MINSVTITSPLGEIIKLELRNPEKSGFLVLGIDGLGPSKGNINTTETPTLDGSLFNSSRILQRNIVFDLGFMNKPTIELIRQLSYQYFPVKEKIGMLFETDTRIVTIDGLVENNEPEIFSKQEGASISVICPNPFFYSLDTTITLFSGVISSFEFPFSNESLVSKLLVFGDTYGDDEKSIYYTGDSSIGIMVYLNFMGPVVNPIIYNSRTGQTMMINTTKLAALTGSGIISGDAITINTIRGNKSVTLTRGGFDINILNTIDQNTAWFSLVRGDNVFRYDAASGKAYIQMKIENQTIYQGI